MLEQASPKSGEQGSWKVSGPSVTVSLYTLFFEQEKLSLNWNFAGVSQYLYLVSCMLLVIHSFTKHSQVFVQCKFSEKAKGIVDFYLSTTYVGCVLQ